MKARPFAGAVCALLALVCVPAMGQDQDTDTHESTEITTTETSPYEFDLDAPALYYDATPQATGTMQFKLIWSYETSSVRDDNTGITAEMEWGCCEDVEFSLRLPMNLGDGGNDGVWNGPGNSDFDDLEPNNGDGNYDLTAGLLWRLWEEGEADWLPAMAFRAELRAPTGYHSDGFDGEVRAIMTKTLGGHCRGHINAFAKTVNGTNVPDHRPFQWGVVFGVDAPIADNLTLLADYMHRSSYRKGSNNINMLEAGLQWEMAEGHGLHFTTQVGLDDNGDTPNWGAKLAYTFELLL